MLMQIMRRVTGKRPVMWGRPSSDMANSTMCMSPAAKATGWSQASAHAKAQ